MCAGIFCVGISSVLIFWKWSSWQTVNRQIYTNLYCHAYLLKYVSHVHGHAHTLHVDWKKSAQWVSNGEIKTENVGIFSHNGTKTISP